MASINLQDPFARNESLHPPRQSAACSVSEKPYVYTHTDETLKTSEISFESVKPITPNPTCGRTAGATAAEPATSTCTMRAACVRTTIPVATAGRSPVRNLFAFALAPPPLLPSTVSPTGRGIEEAEASSEGANAGGERRYRSGAKAPDSLNARRQTCLVVGRGR